MGLLRSTSQPAVQDARSNSKLKKDSAAADRTNNSTSRQEGQRQKSVSSQERPKTAHSQPERPKTADKSAHERPKTADRQQNVDRRRSFSRPRTANSATSAPSNREKSREREQLEIPMPTQIIEYRTGTDTYSFPTPSPRLPPPHSAAMPVPSERSPRGLPADESPKIGVAIGSPREMPPHWRRMHTVEEVSKALPPRPLPARAMTELSRPPDRGAGQGPKKKASWKNFGGIFARKPSTKSVNQEPFYRVQPVVEQEEPPAPMPIRTLHSAARQQVPSAPTPSPILDRNGPPSAGIHQRSPSMTRGMARLEARAQADRAAFMEKENMSEQSTPRLLRTPSMIQREGFSPTFGNFGAPRSSDEIFKSLDQSADNKRNDSPLSNNEGPGPLRLDLDIPDHHMERYSVMFEDFLNSSGERRPSIIERRQSKLQRKRSLKKLDEANAKIPIEVPNVPQRSVTSPHLSQMPGGLSINIGKKVRSPKVSPVLAAEPEPPVTAVHQPVKRKLVKRSNTAPTMANSPVKQNFSKPRMVMITEPAGGAEGSSDFLQARGLSMYSENSLPPTPTSATDSIEERPPMPPPPPKAMASSKAAVSTHTADSAETWDMLTADPNTTAIPTRQASLARREANPYHRVKTPEDLESRVVQVSVARQVSVSKARKQVRQAVDAKQPLRPRVVELSKNRKSTMVLIEGGED